MRLFGIFAIALASGCASTQTRGDAPVEAAVTQKTDEGQSWTDKGSWFEVDGDNVWMCAVGTAPMGVPPMMTLARALGELGKFARVTVTQQETPGSKSISTKSSVSFATNDPRKRACVENTCYQMVCTNLADSKAEPNFKMFEDLSVEENSALIDALIAYGKSTAK